MEWKIPKVSKFGIIEKLYGIGSNKARQYFIVKYWARDLPYIYVPSSRRPSFCRKLRPESSVPETSETVFISVILRAKLSLTPPEETFSEELSLKLCFTISP